MVLLKRVYFAVALLGVGLLIPIRGYGQSAVDVHRTPRCAYQLSPVYPNPATAQTHLSLAVARAQHVEAVLYDVLGRRVQTLYRGRLEPGRAHEIAIDGVDRAGGLYFVRVTGEFFAATRRVTWIR